MPPGRSRPDVTSRNLGSICIYRQHAPRPCHLSVTTLADRDTHLRDLSAPRANWHGDRESGVSAIDSTEAKRRGREAERKVYERLRAALPAEYRIYPKVAWLGRTAAQRAAGRRGGPGHRPSRARLPRDRGQVRADLARRARQMAAERPRTAREPVRAGEDQQAAGCSRSSGSCQMPRRAGTHRRTGGRIPRRRSGEREDRRTAPGAGHRPDLVFDRACSPKAIPIGRARRWTSRSSSGPGNRTREARPGMQGVDLLEELLSTPIELQSLLRLEVEEGEREVVRLTEAPARPRQLAARPPGGDHRCRRNRQDDARAREGAAARPRGLPNAARLLQPAAGADALAETRTTARPSGSTSRRSTSCARTSGARQGCCRPGRTRLPGVVVDETLPGRPGRRDQKLAGYHAIVVDEGQDFEDGLARVARAAARPSEGRRPVRLPRSRAGDLPRRRRRDARLPRTPRRTAGTRGRSTKRRTLRQGPARADALRTDGRAAEIIEAEAGRDAGGAPKRPPSAACRRAGPAMGDRRPDRGSLEKSDVWRERRFGNEVSGTAGSTTPGEHGARC